MRHFTGAILQLWLVLGFCGLAQATDGQLKDGFELGKFFASSSMLALEIASIQNLADEFNLDSARLSQLLGEAESQSGSDLSVVHAYAIWRLHGLIIPLCEGGLKEGALDPAVLGPLAGSAQLVLADIYLAALEFADNEEISGVAQFAKQAELQGFVDRLLVLAKGAKLQAHPAEPVDSNGL